MRELLCTGGIAFTLAAQANAATLPYTNDFSGTGANTAFTTADAFWSVGGGAYKYVVPNSTEGNKIAASSASLAITNYVARQAFTIQTQFTIANTTASINSNNTIGFGAFGANAAFTGGDTSSAYYLADFAYVTNTANPTTTLRIRALGDITGYTNTEVLVDDDLTNTYWAAQPGKTYTLKLQGTYVGNTLNMTLGLFDAAGTQIGTSATASDTTPLAGQNFGYRNRFGKGGGTIDIAFDNYAITVPEPASLAVLGLAGLTTLSRRRSRQAATRQGA